MIDLTLNDDTKVSIDGTKIWRIRKRYAFDSPEGNARVDWESTYWVKDAAKDVADRTKTELPTLTALTAPNGDPIWFNGKIASGPEYISPGERADNKHSAIILGGKRQIVTETPQEVLAVILAAGGTPMPIREDSMITSALETVESWISPLEDWDPELNE